MGTATRTGAALAVLLLAVACAGCSTSSQRIVTSYSDSDYREVEEELVGEHAVISMVDGDTYDGVIVRIDSDSTAWQIAPQEPVTSVATSDIRRMQIEARGENASGAAFKGFLIGAGAGFMVGAAAGGDNDYYGPAMAGAAGAVTFSLVGLMVGGIIGANAESTTVYEIHPGPEPPPQPDPDADPEEEDTGFY